MRTLLAQNGIADDAVLDRLVPPRGGRGPQPGANGNWPGDMGLDRPRHRVRLVHAAPRRGQHSDAAGHLWSSHHSRRPKAPKRGRLPATAWSGRRHRGPVSPELAAVQAHAQLFSQLAANPTPALIAQATAAVGPTMFASIAKNQAAIASVIPYASQLQAVQPRPPAIPTSRP